MAVSFVDCKGANANTLTTALTGLTNGSTLCILTSWVASTTPPSLASGFNNLGTLNVGSTIAGRMGWKIATGTTESGGTWTNGTTTMGIAYNGASSSGPLNFTSNSGTSTTPTFAAMTLSTLGGTSWVYRVTVDISQTVASTTLSGYTLRDGTGVGPQTNSVVAAWDSNGGLSSNPGSLATSATGGSGTWITFEVEVPVPASGTPTNQFFAMFR